jgi:DNA-binding response OmpR family regulator
MDHQQLNILCADDEPSIRNILDEYFGALGHKIDIADNGSIAYHFARTGNYDLAFIDVDMPVMDGIDCVKAIRERNKSVYIVVMSGGSADEATMGLRYGANAFMPKPFSFESLKKHAEAVHIRKTGNVRLNVDSFAK